LPLMGVGRGNNLESIFFISPVADLSDLYLSFRMQTDEMMHTHSSV
jgi:hypothetical protein